MFVQGKVKVIPYSYCKHAHSLHDIWGPDRATIVLYETEDAYGHWCAMFEVSPTMLEFFDSYGANQTVSYLWFRRTIVRKADNYPYLSDLIKRSGYKNVIYNDQKLQKSGPGTSTCGRWSALRVCCRNVPLKTFQRWFHNQRLPGDSYVTALTMFNR